jgi:hypothetical protein
MSTILLDACFMAMRQTRTVLGNLHSVQRICRYEQHERQYTSSMQCHCGFDASTHYGVLKFSTELSLPIIAVGLAVIVLAVPVLRPCGEAPAPIHSSGMWAWTELCQLLAGFTCDVSAPCGKRQQGRNYRRIMLRAGAFRLAACSGTLVLTPQQCWTVLDRGPAHLRDRPRFSRPVDDGPPTVSDPKWLHPVSIRFGWSGVPECSKNDGPSALVAMALLGLPGASRQ